MPHGGISASPKASAFPDVGPSSNQQRLFFWQVAFPEGNARHQNPSKIEWPNMQADDEKILRLAKEIIIKFIELGRVSPTNFEAHFKSVFWALKKTVLDAQLPDLGEAWQSDREENQDEL
jgi:hypothetical protein